MSDSYLGKQSLELGIFCIQGSPCHPLKCSRVQASNASLLLQTGEGIFDNSQELLPDASKTPKPLLALDVCKISVERSHWITFQDSTTESLPKPQLKEDFRRLNLLINGWQSKTQNCINLDGKIIAMYKGFPPFSSPEA